MLLAFIYGILGMLSIIMFFPSNIFILLFNYIFNTPSIININTLIYTYLIVLILIISTNIKNIDIKKINWRIILLFTINTFISLLFKNNIIPLKNIIINLLIIVILLFTIKKIKTSKEKDTLKYLFVLTIIVLITKLFKIYNYFIIYYISRLFKLDYNIIKKYLYSIILSDIIGFLIINIHLITFNFNILITLISSLSLGIYYLFNYYKINYSRLKYFYLFLLLFLLM